MCAHLYTVSPYCCHFSSRIVSNACCDCIGSPPGLQRDKRATHWEEAPDLWSLVSLRSNYKSWLERNLVLSWRVWHLPFSSWKKVEIGALFTLREEWLKCIDLAKCSEWSLTNEKMLRTALPNFHHIKHNSLLEDGDSRSLFQTLRTPFGHTNGYFTNNSHYYLTHKNDCQFDN